MGEEEPIKGRGLLFMGGLLRLGRWKVLETEQLTYGSTQKGLHSMKGKMSKVQLTSLTLVQNPPSTKQRESAYSLLDSLPCREEGAASFQESSPGSTKNT